MLFNSFDFLIFFPIVTLIYFIIPKRVRYIWLLIASYYFYMCWNPKYVLLLLFSTVVTYLSGLVLEEIKQSKGNEKNKIRAKKISVAVSIVLNIGLLMYFKYTNFFVDVIRDFMSYFGIHLNVPVFDIVLPVGISFYVFQALSYTIDVYRDEIYAEKNFFRYALFVSFFPQLVAGPIERSKNLLKQLAEPREFDYARIRRGLLIMLWGFFLKIVIADRAAVLVNAVYAESELYNGFQLLTANILFAVQIYCDFYGYSTIALGTAEVLGYKLMTNFKNPYFAVSVKDFWRRWHISLSSWLRDYLYIPLGGNRKGKIKKYRNILITFFISGLWHGASYTFLVWGILHGVYQVAEDILAPVLKKLIEKFRVQTDCFSWKLMKIIGTFALVDIAWIFFRAESVSSAVSILVRSCTLNNIGLILNGGLLGLGLDNRNMCILLIALVALIISDLLKEKNINVIEWINKQNIIFRYGLYWSAIILIIFSLDISGTEFIYFQF